MSNRKAPRRNDNHTTDRHDVATGCCGEGANGQRGRSRWKKWSNRTERRNGYRSPKIRKVKRSATAWGATRQLPSKEET